MDTTWHRASYSLRPEGDGTEGTASLFVDYDLGNWVLGLRFECDPCWYGLNIDLGPICIGVFYWRRVKIES